MTVVVTDDRITAIGKTGKVPVPKDARITDAPGKYLIPGFWDMHVHNTRDQSWGKTVFLPLFIANGVTGVRDMGGPGNTDPEAVFNIRDEIREGKLLGPRIRAAGYTLFGPIQPGKGDIRISNESDARAAVDLVKKSGADFVKVHDLIPRDAYFAIADEAKKRGLPFAGHVPLSVDAIEAADAGQRSIEHEYGIAAAISTIGPVLRKQASEDLQSGYDGKITPADASRKFVAYLKRLDESYGEQRAALVFNHLDRAGLWVCPTLAVLRSIAFADDPNLATDPRLKYIPPILKILAWNPKFNAQLKSYRPEEFAAFKAHFESTIKMVAAMRRANVRFLAGTDTAPAAFGIPYLYPGFSLHDELGLLVRAGFTTMEALQTATRNPAEYFDILESLGTVEAGKIADLVLLEADPLQDIGNTQKIAAVVVNGRWLDRRALDLLLAQAESAAKKMEM